MKTRIEVNQEGDLYVIIPDEIVQELMLEEGDSLYITENEGEVILTF